MKISKFDKINRQFPNVYTLKLIKLRDWLLIGITTIISTQVALYNQVTMEIIIFKTFLVGFSVFIMLLIIDMIIFVFRKAFMKE